MKYCTTRSLRVRLWCARNVKVRCLQRSGGSHAARALSIVLMIVLKTVCSVISVINMATHDAKGKASSWAMVPGDHLFRVLGSHTCDTNRASQETQSRCNDIGHGWERSTIATRRARVQHITLVGKASALIFDWFDCFVHHPGSLYSSDTLPGRWPAGLIVQVRLIVCLRNALE